MTTPSGLKQRLFIVTDRFFPYDYSTAWYMNRIACGLSEQFDVHVMTSNSEKMESGFLDLSRVSIHRSRVSAEYSTSLIKRLIDARRVSKGISRSLHSVLRSTDVVFVTTNPPTLPHRIVKLCNKRGAKCILNIQDLFPDTLAVTMGMSTRSKVFEIAARFSVRSLNRFSLICSDGRDTLKLTASRCGVKCPPLHYFPHWTDLDTIKPKHKSDSKIIKKNGWENHFVIQITGNLGRLHDIDLAVRLINHFRRDERVRWVISENMLRALNKFRRQEMMSNPAIHFVPFQSAVEFADTLSASDIHLILMRPNTFGNSSPSRALNILATGRPIVATAEPGSELELLIEGGQCGEVVPPGDSVKLINVLTRLINHQDMLSKWSENGQSAMKRLYNEELIILRIKSVIGSL